MLETYHLINFSLGGNKTGTGGGFTGVSEQFRDLMPDKRIFSVYNSRIQSLLFKIKKSYFNIKAALKVFN